MVRQKTAIGGRVPVYGKLLGVLAEQLGSYGDRLATAWRDRTFNAYYDRPLLVLAALRADVLRTGSSHPLWPAIGAGEPDVEGVDSEAVVSTLGPDSLHVWSDLSTRFVQTNETLRAVTWLWPVREIAPTGAPVLVDLGASAGLNLVADRLDCPWHDGGVPLVEPGPVPTRLRLGLDVRPLDACNEQDALWLRACVWPGETDRIGRLDAALEAYGAIEPSDRPVLEECDVSDWVGRLSRLRAEHPGALLFCYQSMVRDYLPEQQRAAWESSVRRWLSSEPAGRSVLVSLEMADLHAGLDCAIEAGVAAGGGVVDLKLARTGFHPVEVNVDPASVARFKTLCAGL